jgi:redox-sensitive bicupin YhaK (pirin superfamily)
MLIIRRDDAIWREQGDWFRARWHFSFDHYRDPANEHFGAMRVFNDDRLIPGAIWPLHPHSDVEGITYVVEGTFRHQDNVDGPPGPLPAGSIQRMTLGSGAWHSEQNASETEPMRFIQIWILPDTAGLPPGVEQRVFTTEDRTNRLLEVVGPEGTAWVTVHQDASVYVARLEAGTKVTHRIGGERPATAPRGAYIYLISGAATIDGQAVATGDSAKVTDQAQVEIEATDTTELILVDVPLVFHPVGVWAGRE